jgi:hypothetical protein
MLAAAGDRALSQAVILHRLDRSHRRDEAEPGADHALRHGAAIRFWNYALYCAAIAAGVLILVDLPRPSNYDAVGYRVLWTLCGAGIGVLVMLLATLFGKTTENTPSDSASPEAAPALQNCRWFGAKRVARRHPRLRFRPSPALYRRARSG